MMKIREENENWINYTSMFVLAEVICGFCAGFSLGILDKVMPSFGNPEKYMALTVLGNYIYTGILGVAGLVIISLFIVFTVKFKRNKGGLQQILPLWGLAMIAGIFGIALAISGFSVSGMLGETLLVFLDTKFELFRNVYMPACS